MIQERPQVRVLHICPKFPTTGQPLANAYVMLGAVCAELGVCR